MQLVFLLLGLIQVSLGHNVELGQKSLQFSLIKPESFFLPFALRRGLQLVSALKSWSFSVQAPHRLEVTTRFLVTALAQKAFSQTTGAELCLLGSSGGPDGLLGTFVFPTLFFNCA